MPIRTWIFGAIQIAMNVAGGYELKFTYKLAFLMFWIYDSNISVSLGKPDTIKIPAGQTWDSTDSNVKR